MQFFNEHEKISGSVVNEIIKFNKDLKNEIKELESELAFYRKLSEDFDGSVRYLMTVAPQLDELLQRHLNHLKKNKK